MMLRRQHCLSIQYMNNNNINHHIRWAKAIKTTIESNINMLAKRRILFLFLAGSGLFTMFCYWTLFFRLDGFNWKASEWDLAKDICDMYGTYDMDMNIFQNYSMCQCRHLRWVPLAMVRHFRWQPIFATHKISMIIWLWYIIEFLRLAQPASLI